MQTAVEKVSELKRRLKVTVPAARIEQEVAKRLQKQAKTIKLDGFRPGKVPLDVVKRQFEPAIRQEVVGDLIRETFIEAITAEKLELAGPPQIHPKPDIANAGIEYEAEFEIYPEIKLQDLSGSKIEKLKVEITDTDIAKVLEKLQTQYAEWVNVDRAAKEGDKVIIDFEGSIDGVKFPGGTANNVNVVLGKNTMIPGFEEGLVGAKAGESRDLNIDFPKEYPSKDLAGKAATFAVKIHQVQEAKLSELNDDFAKRLDVENLAALREEVRKSMERELSRHVKENLKQQVIDALVKLNPIDVPDSLIDAEIKVMQQQLQQRMGANKKNVPAIDLPKEPFQEQAKQRVIVGLLLAEFVKAQQLQPEMTRVRAMVEEIASAYDHPEQIVMQYMQNKSVLSQIQSLVLEEQAIEKLADSARVEEKNATYDEVVNKAS